MSKHTINFTKLQLSVNNKIFLPNFEQKLRSFLQSNFKKVSNIYPFFSWNCYAFVLIKHCQTFSFVFRSSRKVALRSFWAKTRNLPVLCRSGRNLSISSRNGCCINPRPRPEEFHEHGKPYIYSTIIEGKGRKRIVYFSISVYYIFW